MIFFRKILLLLPLLCSIAAKAQEFILPLQENRVVKDRAAVKDNVAFKPTALSLPFFEDFTDTDPYPDPSRWQDRCVYVNNTMGRNMISRGVATFDALNERGAVYYDTIEAYTQIYADSLTSFPVDLSSHTPADSVYLSFFYQPKGYGFSPKPYDSLLLFLLKSNGVWEEVWAAGGDTLQPFRQVMIPVNDTGYFNDRFQMRWINKATKGISDSHWNLDYIRLDENRGQYDTTVRDIAFTKDPASILNDFSAMPFRHFKTDPASFLSATLTASLHNNGNTLQNVTAGYTARVLSAGTNLGTGTNNVSLNAYTESDAAFPMYNAGSFTPANPNDKVVYENRFYCSSNYPGESKINDTILYHQVFDNYFAYDDGTAEQSYFLNLLPNAPGSTAVEYALYAPDTLRGIAIRFSRTIPASDMKEFSIAVYQDIAVNGGTDDLLYQEDFLYPQFEDSINKLSVYTFEQPQLLNSGIFYIAIIQAAGGTSDSLQIALDANRTGGNHRYFKVANTWQSSQLEGALLLRPIVGAVLPVGIRDVHLPELPWSISPNPAHDKVHIQIPALRQASATFYITDIQGKTMLTGAVKNDTDINIQSLPAGMYFVRISTAAGYIKPAKLIKL